MDAESLQVATVSDPAAAAIYTAMLRSARIPVRTQGELLGPYVMTVGQWAVTSLWVPASLWDDAVEVLTAGDPDPSLVILDRGSGDLGPLPLLLRVVAWGVAVLVAASIALAVARAW